MILVDLHLLAAKHDFNALALYVFFMVPTTPAVISIRIVITQIGSKKAFEPYTQLLVNILNAHATSRNQSRRRPTHCHLPMHIAPRTARELRLHIANIR